MDIFDGKSNENEYMANINNEFRRKKLNKNDIENGQMLVLRTQEKIRLFSYSCFTLKTFVLSCFLFIFYQLFSVDSAYASDLTNSLVYDNLNRLKEFSLSNSSYQLAINYTYDAAGNITKITSSQVVKAKTLADAIRYLQVLSGGNPAGVSKDDDISHDDRIGLEEVMGTLQRLSQ